MTRKVCLDLFSGLGGFSAAFEDADGWDVVTVEIDPDHDPDICADVMGLRPSDLPNADVILASPPCIDFSLACMNQKWDTADDRTPRLLPKWESIPNSVALVFQSLYLTHEADPDYWFLENPRWGVLKDIIGEPTGTVHYCQYGTEYQKPTGLWGRHPPMEYRTCRPGEDCHWSNDKGGVTARPSKYSSDHGERSLVPYDLSASILEAVEDAYENPPPEQAELPGVKS